jgi:hypothetical protein
MALEIYLVHLNEKSHVDGAWNSVVPLAWTNIFNQGINAWEKRLVCIETLSDFRKASCASGFCQYRRRRKEAWVDV